MQQATQQLINRANEGNWSMGIKITETNNLVNGLVTHTKDRSDYWQTPQETMDRCTGDCEDIAILKAHILRKMGLKPRLAYCKFKYAPHLEAHIVCVINDHVLDVRNVNPMVKRTHERDDLAIQFYFNHHSLWAGGQVYKMAKVNFTKFKSMLARNVA